MTTLRPLDGRTTLAIVQRVSVSAGFCAKLRSTLEEGEASVNRLIRSYDPVLADHHREVTNLAMRIARRLGLSADMVRGIGLASSIHDIGAIGAPGTFGPGTDMDMGTADPASTHSRRGASIVDDLRFPWPIAVMILQHHEHVDGSGYPEGLDGHSILLGARVITAADAVASRTTGIPSLDFALTRLAAGRGSHYDAGVVDACLSLFPVPTGDTRPVPIRRS